MGVVTPIMLRAHKIRLNPTPDQQVYFFKAAGTKRYAYNWAVAQWRDAIGKKPTVLELKKQFNAIKPVWTYEVTKCAAEGAFMDFGAALQNYYEGRAGEPQFKKRNKGEFKFYLANDRFDVVGNWVKIPKLGLVNMAEKLRFEGKIMGAKVSKEADWWYISITLACIDIKHAPKPQACRIDVGILRIATLSDGVTFDNLRPLKAHLTRLATLQRLLSGKQVGSRNRERLKYKIARLHKRIRDLREDYLHKLTHYVATRYGFVSLEDLNVKGMTQNRRLAQALHDAALGRLLALLETKVAAAGGRVVKVGRFFASSKTCSHCGQQCNDLTLSDREFQCKQCGLTLDRDLNAALNILHEGWRQALELSISGTG